MKTRALFFFSFGAALLVSASLNAASAADSSAAASSAAIAHEAYEALSKGNMAEAIANYSKAISLGGMEPKLLAHVLLNRALAYQKLGSHQEALTDYSSALHMDVLTPDLRAIAFYNRGIVYDRLGRMALAIEDYTGALFIKGDLAEAYFGRAESLRSSRQFISSLPDYEKAEYYNYKDTAQLYYSKAMVYKALNRLDDYKKSLKRSLIDNPNFEPAKKALSITSNVDLQKEEAVQLAGKSKTSVSVAAASVAETGWIVKSEATGKKRVKKILTDRLPSEDGANDAMALTSAPVPTENQTDDPPVTSSITRYEQTNTKILPTAKGWSVQLAAADSEESARKSWNKLQRHHKALSRIEPNIIKSDMGNEETVYRVRYGEFSSASQANNVCRGLRKSGVKCFVGKNSL